MVRPPLLLVVGMHRSGTSLLGGLLQRLGCALPGERIEADVHNPEGYFEWDEVVAIQERLLIDLDRWWPSHTGTLALPEAWLDHPATDVARANLRELLCSEAQRQQSLWAIKDPRCSRLLPLWIELTSELEIPLQLLLAVRDPAEVSASLLRRDGPLTGMDANRAQQLWWRHNLEVVHAARGASVPLAVVDFDAWFQQPRVQLERILKAFPALQPSESQCEQALALIEPDHRRSINSADPQALVPVVRRLHRRLLRQPLRKRFPSAEPPAALIRGTVPATSCSALTGHPETWSDWLEQHAHYPAPRCHSIASLASDPRLHVCGLTWLDLEPHQLLQRSPWPELSHRPLDPDRSSSHCLRLEVDPASSGSLEAVAINLELPPVDRAPHWLEHLRAQQLILDPLPSRVLLLRSLGLPAWWLDPMAPTNGWLDQPPASSPAAWVRFLGMAAPASNAVIVLGPLGHAFDLALQAEASAGIQASIPIQYWPGWPELRVNDAATGLARAGWLAAASRIGATLVQAHQVPSGLTPADLRDQHTGSESRVVAEDRPSPGQDVLFEWDSGQGPQAAVVVSLFEYADRIDAALESIRSQTLNGLELIVVDDASSDSGSEVVQTWMAGCCETAGHPFARLQLVRHRTNAGLAVARNSAFASARSDWCFVLDADNALYPSAVEACLRLAETGEESLAVVHPLLAVEVEAGRSDDQRSLVSTASWQRSRLLEGNVVDAMALVRRRAWQRVGGYTHIDGGWEDFDFWCKLIEAGFDAVQCPQLLAVYRSHDQSMSHRATNRSWRALSRTLQDRHPWLELPLACP